MKKEKWTTEKISNQRGKVIIVTGATSGLGKQASKILSEKEATVVMGVRNVDKAEEVKKEFLKSNPKASVDILKLELGSLASIKEFANTFLTKYDRLDVLINNAGIMMCPYSKTSDGFEIQMGTNHFGPFALTGLLMPILKETQGARIVSTSSLAHLGGNINFNDIHWEARKYKTNKAYSDSKIANLYFTYEMARRNKNPSGFPTVVTAHPGWTKTDLLKHSLVLNALNPIFGQTPEMGTLPTLRAATDPSVKSGDFFGPDKMWGMRGHPVLVTSNPLSKDEEMAKTLWKVSEELTNVRY